MSLTIRAKSAKLTTATTKGANVAAGQLSAPGTEFGPCGIEDDKPTCVHPGCWTTHGMATSRCVHCGKPIGYETGFFNVTSYDERAVGVQTLAHELCEYESVEASR